MTDLTAELMALSDDALAATLILLGEQAQEITNATALVRNEQQCRAVAPAVVLGEVGMSVLTECVAAAPALAKQIASEAPVAEAAVDG